MTDQQVEAGATQVDVQGKISVKTVGADPSQAKGKAANERVSLMKVFGECTKVDYKKDADGNLQQVLVGKFEAINTQEGNAAYGRTTKSGKLYLPSGIQEMIAEAVEQSDGEMIAAQFALEIYATSAANRVGYTYGGVALASPSVSDPLAAMRAQALSLGTALKAAPALEGPAKAAK